MGHRRTGTRCSKLYWGLAVKEERRKLSIGKFGNGEIRKCAIYYHLSSGFFLIRFVSENPVFSFPYGLLESGPLPHWDFVNGNTFNSWNKLSVPDRLPLT